MSKEKSPERRIGIKYPPPDDRTVFADSVLVSLVGKKLPLYWDGKYIGIGTIVNVSWHPDNDGSLWVEAEV